jgi:hypothetical protein
LYIDISDIMTKTRGKRTSINKKRGIQKYTHKRSVKSKSNNHLKFKSFKKVHFGGVITSSPPPSPPLPLSKSKSNSRFNFGNIFNIFDKKGSVIPPNQTKSQVNTTSSANGSDSNVSVDNVEDISESFSKANISSDNENVFLNLPKLSTMGKKSYFKTPEDYYNHVKNTDYTLYNEYLNDSSIYRGEQQNGGVKDKSVNSLVFRANSLSNKNHNYISNLSKTKKKRNALRYTNPNKLQNALRLSNTNKPKSIVIFLNGHASINPPREGSSQKRLNTYGCNVRMFNPIPISGIACYGESYNYLHDKDIMKEKTMDRYFTRLMDFYPSNEDGSHSSNKRMDHYQTFRDFLDSKEPLPVYPQLNEIPNMKIGERMSYTINNVVKMFIKYIKLYKSTKYDSVKRTLKADMKDNSSLNLLSALTNEKNSKLMQLNMRNIRFDKSYSFATHEHDGTIDKLNGINLMYYDDNFNSDTMSNGNMSKKLSFMIDDANIFKKDAKYEKLFYNETSPENSEMSLQTIITRLSSYNFKNIYIYDLTCNSNSFKADGPQSDIETMVDEYSQNNDIAHNVIITPDQIASYVLNIKKLQKAQILKISDKDKTSDRKNPVGRIGFEWIADKSDSGTDNSEIGRESDKSEIGRESDKSEIGSDDEVERDIVNFFDDDNTEVVAMTNEITDSVVHREIPNSSPFARLYHHFTSYIHKDSVVVMGTLRPEYAGTKLDAASFPTSAVEL